MRRVHRTIALSAVLLGLGSLGTLAQAQTGNGANARPGEGAWANYDFVPGERVIFAEDFARDRVGNFPQRLEFVAGNAEVVESRGQRWLRASESTRLAVPLGETLPQRSTIEYDITIPSDWESILFFSRERMDDFESGVNGACCYVPGPAVFITASEVGVRRDADNAVSKRAFGEMFGEEDPIGRPVRIRVHVDGNYLKVYLNETRMANVPNLPIRRGNRLYIDLNAHADAPVLLGNLSVNAGGGGIYEALAAEGRVSTQGILFDTGSDRIRPESTPTLAEIVTMLQQHADLRLTIEGHTDNVGQAAANQTLSEKRAAAVKAYLVSQGIDAGRLQSQGFGATRPKASNDTPEGRQTNRRVELVRL